MQNRYVGDIGDFANNGLLRWLTGMTGPRVSQEKRLRLGVVWYLHPDETNKGDGRYKGYLKNTKSNCKVFRKCDPGLYDILGCLVEDKDRSVVALQQGGILPDDTRYYQERLFYTRKEQRPEQSKSESWLEGAVKAIKEADIVFLNPDNGIASTGIERKTRYSPKHVYMDELKRFAKEGHSLVIYHHLQYNKNLHNAQIQKCQERLQSKFGDASIWVLKYQSQGPGRAYFIVAHPDHKCVIKKRLTSFSDSHWFKNGHFTEPPPQKCSP